MTAPARPPTIDPLRQHAQTILTPKQFDAWDLHRRGMSLRQLELALNISRSAIKDHLRAANRKLTANPPTKEPD